MITSREADSAPRGPIVVRDAALADMASVAAIYAHHVLHGLATFEEAPPSVQDMISRRDKVLKLGLPYLVAQRDGRIAGYCYAGPYRTRPAYRYTVEDSVYVAEDLRGQGIGTALLGELIARCGNGPWRQMLAVIGHSENMGSRALHARMGFRLVGTLTAVGFKLGQWVDTVMMQRELGGPEHADSQKWLPYDGGALLWSEINPRRISR